MIDTKAKRGLRRGRLSEPRKPGPKASAEPTRLDVVEGAVALARALDGLLKACAAAAGDAPSSWRDLNAATLAKGWRRVKPPADILSPEVVFRGVPTKSSVSVAAVEEAIVAYLASPHRVNRGHVLTFQLVDLAVRVTRATDTQAALNFIAEADRLRGDGKKTPSRRVQEAVERKGKNELGRCYGVFKILARSDDRNRQPRGRLRELIEVRLLA